MTRPETYVVLVLALLSSPFAKAEEGRPVTASDLSGRTICWSDGWRLTYAADGRYFGDRANQPPKDHRTDDGRRWAFLEPGVIQIDSGPTKIKKHLQITVLPDGQLQQHSFNGRSTRGTENYLWGKICS
jgi:hypothetical protein